MSVAVPIGMSNDTPMKQPSWRTRAPFLVNNRWTWVAWTHEHGNKHAAMIEQGEKLGATAWDYGQADHGLVGRVNF